MHVYKWELVANGSSRISLKPGSLHAYTIVGMVCLKTVSHAPGCLKLHVKCASRTPHIPTDTRANPCSTLPLV